MSCPRSLKLPNGAEMPILGFGTWQPPNIGNRESHVEKFLDLSQKKLQLDYVDLYLINTPFGLNYKDDETTIPMKPDKTADLDMSTDLIAIWKANDDELEAALDCALATGYRHIDTAYVYRNEHVVGKVLKKWLDAKKVTREELFIVTKLPNIGNRESHVEKFLDLSLKKLQLDYVDLYLIHTPFGLNYKDDETTIPMKPDKTADLDMSTDLIAIWKKMEEMVDKGKTKAIGVSNFSIDQVKRILQVARIRPATNQVELHVYNQQRALEEYLKSENITLTAYSSLGTGGSVHFMAALGVKRELPNLMSNPTVKEIAEEVGKTPAQVLLRFVIQRGIATIPKSTKPERIKQNFDIFDFELSGAQMDKLFALDQKARILKMEEFFVGLENHPEYPFKSA